MDGVAYHLSLKFLLGCHGVLAVVEDCADLLFNRVVVDLLEAFLIFEPNPEVRRHRFVHTLDE